MKDLFKTNQELTAERSVLIKRIQELEQTSSEKIREESEIRARQLRVLHETSVELTAELNLEALLRSIVQRALNLIGGKSCNCYIFNPELDLMERVATAGEDLVLGGKMRQRGEGAVGQVWAAGVPLLINDYNTWPGRKKDYDNFPSRAIVALPIRWSEEFLGVLNILAYTPHRYTQADMDMFGLFATQAAIAIRNARLHEKMKMELAERKRVEEALQESEKAAKRLARESELIAEIGRIITSTVNIEEVFERFAEKVREAIPFDRIAVNTVNMKDYTRTILYVKGDRFSGHRLGEVYSLAGTATEEIVRTKVGLLINSKNIIEMRGKLSGTISLQLGAQSSILVPLISKDEVIAALAIHSTQTDAYSENDLRLAERVGSQIAGAVANAQLFLERQRAEEALRSSEEEARRLAKENEVISEIGRIISSSLNIDDVYERFAEEVRKLILVDRLTINIVNPEDNTAHTAYISGTELPHRRKGDVYPLAFTVTEEVWRTRRGVIIDEGNYHNSLNKFPGVAFGMQAGFRSLMVAPMISKGEVIGVLQFRSTRVIAYSDKDLGLAERVGDQIAGAIANAELFAEHKRWEEERRGLQARLYRAEKMEVLGTLAGGVAHDLNNILGVFSGYSELIMEGLPAGSPLKKYAANILKSSEKAAAIIQDLLTLTRRGVMMFEVIDLNKVVANLLATPEIATLQAYHPHVTVKTDLGKGLLKIKGSPVHLEKTVMNLMSNAAEAILGKGEVTIRTENRYLDKAVRGYDKVEEGEYVVLTVTDTGAGISSEDMNKMFEPFYTKKIMGRSGTGLGLAIVWGTVKDHEGYIDVQSIEGKGTTLTLYFPVTREQMLEAAKKVPTVQYMGHGESVLVVDDMQEQRQVATTLLTRLGYQVNAVASGEEALAYLENHQVDLLVLDMIMDPGIDGYETYKRALEINHHQKAIIVSGFSETEQVRKAQKLGAGVYVKKPYMMENFGVSVRDELLKVTSGNA